MGISFLIIHKKESKIMIVGKNGSLINNGKNERK